MHHFDPVRNTPTLHYRRKAGNACLPAGLSSSYPPDAGKLSYVTLKTGSPRQRATIHKMVARAKARRTTVRRATVEWYQAQRGELARLGDVLLATARRLAGKEGIAGISACGQRVFHRAIGVEVHQDPTSPSGWRTGQLWSCNNMACPACGPRRAAARGHQADAAVDAWLERHGAGTVLLVTNSVWHDSKSNLKELTKILKAAWQKARRRMRENGGADARGWRAVEVTLGGPHGSHPHLHSLMFFPSPAAADDAVENWNTWFIEAVKRLRKSRRYYTPAYADPEAQDIRRVEAGASHGRYIAKGGWSIGKEVALAHGKTGRSGGVSILEALKRASKEPNGQGPWSDLYRELLKATRGMRWWQPFGKIPDKMRTVMEAADAEMKEEAAERRKKMVHIATISTAAWHEIVDTPEVIGSLRKDLGAIAAQNLANEAKIEQMREAVLAWAAVWQIDENDISFPRGADPRTCSRGGCDPPF